MFCPKCKAEYQTDILVCDDCQVDLVEDLSLESFPPSEQEEFECISEFFGIDFGRMSVLKSVLDDENISYFIQGENALYMQPGVSARFLVAKSQVERVREILKDLL